MNFGCENLHELVHNLPLVQECDRVRSGALRLSTPFVYPNGEHIDLFLERTRSLFEGYSLSDYGQTGLFLKDSRVQYSGTAKKKQLLDDVLHQCGVRLKQGDLYIEINADQVGDISESIFRLTQACVRIADFALHQRLRSANPFRDDIEVFFDAHEITYMSDVKVMGKFKKDVKLDFSVMGHQRLSYVLLLASMNEASAHASANEIFRKWYDLSDSPGNRVTIYNSASSSVRTEDIERLREGSSVISYPDEEEVLMSTLIGAVA